MKLSKAAAAMMHKYEGYKNRPYLCPAHIWTIGYGHVLYQEQIHLPMFRPEGKTKADIIKLLWHLTKFWSANGLKENRFRK